MKRQIIVLVLAIVLVGGFLGYRNQPSVDVNLSEFEVATFAGGCFWCMEAAFESFDGVAEAISGYTGGEIVNPTYEQVSRGGTGHFEAVQVYYDPDVVSYAELLDVFWRNIDPTDDGGQFFDRGTQYLTAVFYHNEAQRLAAMVSRDALNASGVFDEPVVTGILEFSVFYEAEEYHQDYYRKNVLQYKLYSSGSGREDFIEEHWGE
jgi:peptide methionine sulfoxide reductase msrA/msrB